jgi:phage host-nuclease inhibitor protein Gam
MARQKMKVVPTVSHQEAEQAMALFAQSSTELKKIEVLLEQEKQLIDGKYLDEISRLKTCLQDQAQVLQHYGEANKDSWKGKSLDLALGKIGFRTGTPKLIKDKGHKWEAITELVRRLFPKYVRTSYEINKEALIAARTKREFEKIKKSCYVDIVQEETFFVETKEETLATA